MFRKITYLALLLIFLSLKSIAAIIYVDSANVNGLHSGSSWATAYTDLQAAIDASVSGDVIWVAKGSYPRPSSAWFSMREGVKILGGFLNTNTSVTQRNYQTNATILKGNGNVMSNSGTGLTRAAVLDGFTITNNSVASYPYSAAMYNYNVSPTITNCKFINNLNTSGNGGALYCERGNGIISNCTFENNKITDQAPATAGAYGAGACFVNSNYRVDACTFSNNAALSWGNSSLGGGLCSYNGNDTLLGCTFFNNSTSSGSVPAECAGGGVYIQGGSVNNCTFTNNIANGNLYVAASSYAIGWGGGIFCSGGKINNCVFTGNISTAYGGGIMLKGNAPSVSQCTLNNNNAFVAGGGIYNIGDLSNITNCSFTGNKRIGLLANIPPVGGGGLYNRTATGTVSKCTFYGNGDSLACGGAIYNDTVGPAFKINNCSFTNNQAKRGAAVYNYKSLTNFTNCLFSKNSADSIGGAVYNYKSAPKMTNCTIACNKAKATGNSGSGVYSEISSSPTLNNSIVWGNTTGVYSDPTSNLGIKYGLIQGSPAIPGSFILAGTTDPLFVDTAVGNYTLKSASPCIDMGRNDSIPSGITTDLGGNNRIYNTTVDLGAYEYFVTLPVVNLGNDTSFCAGNSIILDAKNAQNGSITYLWNTGATTQTISVASTGTYYVAVTNALGTTRDTIVITVNPNPIVNLGNDTAICAGSTLTLNAQNPGSTYSWSTGATTQSVNVNVGNAYYVAVTDVNQCKSVDTIVVAVSPVPVVNLGNDTSFCAGNAMTLNAQNTGSTYSWNTSATTQAINVNATASYFVTVTNASHCTAADTIQVTVKPVPAVSLGNDTAFCSGNTLNLNAQNTGSTYVWNTGATTQNINVNATGIYYVTVTGANQCKGRDTIGVVVNLLPIVNLGNDSSFCAGSTFALNAQIVGSTYNWSTGGTTQSINVNTAGTYYVTVTDGNLCKGSDTIQLSVNPLPIVHLGNDTSFCAGNTIVLNAQNSGSSYYWNTGATAQKINVNTSGTYFVTVTDANSCKGHDTIVVALNPLPVVNLGNDTTIVTGTTITLNAGNAGATYAWSTGATTQTISVGTAGTYIVGVTSNKGCTASDGINVYTTPSGVSSVPGQERHVSVYPNPATGSVTIDCDDPALLHSTAVLTDVYGHIVASVSISGQSQKLPLSELAPGVYLLKMSDGKSFKIIKQ